MHTEETKAKIGAGNRANSGMRGRFGEMSPTWKGDSAGVHHRLNRDRGKASSYTCVDCGGQAVEWSYRGGALDERSGVYGPESPSLEFYDPRCVACHRRYDSPLHPRKRQ